MKVLTLPLLIIGQLAQLKVTEHFAERQTYEAELQAWKQYERDMLVYVNYWLKLVEDASVELQQQPGSKYWEKEFTHRLHELTSSCQKNSECFWYQEMHEEVLTFKEWFALYQEGAI